MNRRDAFRAGAAFVLGAPIAAEAVMREKPVRILAARCERLLWCAPSVEFPEGGIFKSSRDAPYVTPVVFDATWGTLAEWSPIGFTFHPDGTTTFVDGRKP